MGLLPVFPCPPLLTFATCFLTTEIPAVDLDVSRTFGVTCSATAFLCMQSFSIIVMSSLMVFGGFMDRSRNMGDEGSKPFMNDFTATAWLQSGIKLYTSQYRLVYMRKISAVVRRMLTSIESIFGWMLLVTNRFINSSSSSSKHVMDRGFNWLYHVMIGCVRARGKILHMMASEKLCRDMIYRKRVTNNTTSSFASYGLILGIVNRVGGCSVRIASVKGDAFAYPSIVLSVGGSRVATANGGIVTRGSGSTTCVL